jgi:hypothetical protein
MIALRLDDVGEIERADAEQHGWRSCRPLLRTVLPEGETRLVAIEKKVMVGRIARSAYWLNHDPSGLVEAGYGPATK